jgi:hypothetical protein
MLNFSCSMIRSAAQYHAERDALLRHEAELGVPGLRNLIEQVRFNGASEI